jgi:hypothetical protein
LINCIQDNSKTYRSLDLSTICPRLKAGNPCSYCYVQESRRKKYRAKGFYETHYNHEILRLKDSTLVKLNKMGGLRMFSFGDYEPWMDDDIKNILDDSALAGLRLKAITKQPEFVKKYNKYKNLTINYSLDFNSGVPKWIRQYKTSNVKLRMMVRNEHEVKKYHRYVDILTPYHGRKINDNYRAVEAKEACLNLAPQKTCCRTHDCSTCEVRCGYKN